MPPVLSKLPVMMSDEDVIDKRYENCVIYKLVHKEDEDAYEKYVGHTINFRKRKNKHIEHTNKETSLKYNSYLYKYIRENGGWDCWEMIKIEDYPCKNEIEAKKKERDYILKLKSMNYSIPLRTKKEHYQDTKEHHYKKKREWKLNNLEKSNEYHKNYYLNNKDKWKKTEKVECDNCGSIILKVCLNRHKKTKKCLEHNAL